SPVKSPQRPQASDALGVGETSRIPPLHRRPNGCRDYGRRAVTGDCLITDQADESHDLRGTARVVTRSRRSIVVFIDTMDLRLRSLHGRGALGLGSEPWRSGRSARSGRRLTPFLKRYIDGVSRNWSKNRLAFS